MSYCSLLYLDNMLRICPQFLIADSERIFLSLRCTSVFKEVLEFASHFEDSLIMLSYCMHLLSLYMSFNV